MFDWNAITENLYTNLTGSMLRQTLFLVSVFMGIMFLITFFSRQYMMYVQLPKKGEYYHTFRPDNDQWIDYSGKQQVNEMKGLIALVLLLGILGASTPYSDQFYSLALVFVGLSMYNYMVGAARPYYVLTYEGFFYVSWMPIFARINGFYPWSQFIGLEKEDDIWIIKGERRSFPILANRSDEKKMRFFIADRLKEARGEPINPKKRR